MTAQSHPAPHTLDHRQSICEDLDAGIVSLGQPSLGEYGFDATAELA